MFHNCFLNTSYNQFADDYSFEDKIKKTYKQTIWDQIRAVFQPYNPQPAQQLQQQNTSQTYNALAAQGKVFGPVNPASGFQQYTPPSVLGAGTSVGGGSGGQQGQQQVNQPNYPSGPSSEAIDAIDALYNQTIASIGPLEEQTRGQQTADIQSLRTGQTRQQQRLKEEQTERQGEVTRRETETGKQAQSALEQLRQLFQETQQGQVAQLSAAGISQSSAAEALAATLGREMAQRIAGVTGSRDEVMTNLADERQKINTFVSRSLTELEQDTNTQVEQINRDYAGRLAQLGQIRGQAAVARQQQRGQLFQAYQDQMMQIQQANYQSQLALQQWHQQQQTKIATAVNQIQTLPLADIPNLRQQGLTVSGRFSPGQNAIINPMIRTTTRNQEEDLFNQFFPGFGATPLTNR